MPAPRWPYTFFHSPTVAGLNATVELDSFVQMEAASEGCCAGSELVSQRRLEHSRLTSVPDEAALDRVELTRLAAKSEVDAVQGVERVHAHDQPLRFLEAKDLRHPDVRV